MRLRCVRKRAGAAESSLGRWEDGVSAMAVISPLGDRVEA
jgi:hypothetical protein